MFEIIIKGKKKIEFKTRGECLDWAFKEGYVEEDESKRNLLKKDIEIRYIGGGSRLEMIKNNPPLRKNSTVKRELIEKHSATEKSSDTQKDKEVRKKDRPQNKNLIPIRDSQEATKRGRNGAKASLIAKKKKKTMRELLSILLHQNLTPIEKDTMRRLFPEVDVEDLTKESAILMAQITKAISKQDTKAATFIRDTAGEKPEVVIKGDGLNVPTPTINVKQEDIEEMIKKLK